MLQDLRWAFIVTLFATSVGCGPPPVAVGDCELTANVPYMSNSPNTYSSAVMTCPASETITLEVCEQEEQAKGVWKDLCCASGSKVGEKLTTQTATCRRQVGVFYRTQVTGTANGSSGTAISDSVIGRNDHAES